MKQSYLPLSSLAIIAFFVFIAFGSFGGSKKAKKNTVSKQKINVPKYIDPMDTIKDISTFKRWIDEEVEEIKRFDLRYATNVTQLVSEKNILLEKMKMVSKAKSIGPEAEEYANKIKSELKRTQIKYFPEMRRMYGEFMDKQLWEQDINVKVIGSKKDRIQFIGGTFAANRNIKDFHEVISPILVDLRFKRVDYKWIPSATEYDYSDINSRNDDDLISR